MLRAQTFDVLEYAMVTFFTFDYLLRLFIAGMYTTCALLIGSSRDCLLC